MGGCCHIGVACISTSAAAATAAIAVHQSRLAGPSPAAVAAASANAVLTDISAADSAKISFVGIALCGNVRVFKQSVKFLFTPLAPL